jgi:hypothetical protein
VLGSLYNTLHGFKQHLTEVFNLRFIDDMYQDIGHEVCPPEPPLSPTLIGNEEPAMTYL